MFKKIMTLSALAVFSVCLSGCVKNSVNLEITNDDQAVLTIVSGISNSLLSLTSPNQSPEEAIKSLQEDKKNKAKIEEYQKKGYYISEYKDDNFSGVQLKKTFKKAAFFSSNDLPSGYVLPTEEDTPIKIDKNPFQTKYYIHLTFDIKKLNEENNKKVSSGNGYDKRNLQSVMGGNGGDAMAGTIGSFMQEIFKQPGFKPMVDLTIKIPKEATRHNATKVDEKTHEYVWAFSDMEDVLNQKPAEIILEYKKTNIFSIVFLLLVVILTILVISKNSQYSRSDTDETNEAF